jgi:hypothetical protein
MRNVNLSTFVQVPGKAVKWRGGHGFAHRVSMNARPLTCVACGLTVVFALYLVLMPGPTALEQDFHDNAHVRRARATWLLGVRDEGSTAQAFPEWARNGEMRREAQGDVGLPGWEPGPDYYSTRSWDNAPVKPRAGIEYFDPYIGEGGCPGCVSGGARSITYAFTVDAACEQTRGTQHIHRILHNAIVADSFTDAAWSTVKYHDLTWAEQQFAYLLSAHNARDITLIIPPCFFPRFSVRAQGMLNQAVVEGGLKLLLVGGLTGASFLSDFIAGPDGVGYVDNRFASMIDVVWSEGPFYMTKAAAGTELRYGPQILPGVGNSVVGVPIDALPLDATVHYTSYDQVAVVFEVPSGEGTVLFLGYDFKNLVPEWVDAMLVAERELDARKGLLATVEDSSSVPIEPEEGMLEASAE